MRNFLFIFLALNAYSQNFPEFNYISSQNEVEIKLRKEKRNRRIFDGTLEIEDPITQNLLIVPFEYYRAYSSEPAPLVFIFPPIAGAPVVERMLAARLAKRGYHSVILTLVEDITDKTRPIEGIDDFFIRSTISFMQILDKVQHRPEILQEEFYAMGISLGGIRASIATCVEKRIKKIYTLVAGGNIPEMMAYSKVGVIKKYRKAKMNELGLNTKNEYMLKLEETLKIDPINYAQHRVPSDIFMVLGKRDDKVPFKNQLDLLNAWGNPQHKFINANHRISGASFLFDMKEIVSFLKGK